MKTISLSTYLDILETIHEGVRILDDQGTIIYANKTLCTMLAYEKDELIGKSVFDLYPEADRSQADELFSDRKTGKSSRYETCFISKYLP